MNRSAIRRASAAGLLVLLGACTSGPPNSVDMLNLRLQTTMSTEIAGNIATLQPLPDGAVVTLADGAVLPGHEAAMDNRVRDPRASVVMGLLDPSLMRLSVSDTGSGTQYDRQQRVANFISYLEEYRLGPTLTTPDGTPVTSAMAMSQDMTAGTAPVATPPGLSVTIRVVCPERTSWPGYGQGQSLPACR
ncbi:hypothetical protein [Rhodopila sp.]|jgi:hypothetical protein|uniref:hypothetical protein n=1 Tax=Rhodopila sp. TaxID=2480087 RepID=UPI002CE73A3B|nr:hypothetical protein [Rhodopila sp.]HVZ10089.1 hypothetical protein [Rhodopila sp.]